MRVMVIGASTNPDKYGNKSVRAYIRQGHEVLPVNPKADEIEGVRCYSSITEVPGPIDRATVYLPPKHGIEVVEALAKRGDVQEVWLNPGAESPEVIDRAKALGLTPIVACSIVAIGEEP
ncbi:MAG: CoA-binding protein [Phycisphaerales bacterium]|nr:CoA-binding protein [Phycisphaerales bacterium]